MGTRSKIKLIDQGNTLVAVYYPMDGHVWSFGPTMIKALKATTPKKILENRALLEWIGDMSVDGPEEYLSYLCEIHLTEEDYLIRLYGYQKKLLFEGDLDKFSEQYEDC